MRQRRNPARQTERKPELQLRAGAPAWQDAQELLQQALEQVSLRAPHWTFLVCSGCPWGMQRHTLGCSASDTEPGTKQLIIYAWTCNPHPRCLARRPCCTCNFQGRNPAGGFSLELRAITGSSDFPGQNPTSRFPPASLALMHWLLRRRLAVGWPGIELCALHPIGPVARF